jgi:hypothetical protein
LISYLLKNLKGTDWEIFLDFVSPAFFDVVPTVGMVKAFGTIIRDYRDKRAFEKVRRHCANTALAVANSASAVQLKLVEEFSLSPALGDATVDKQTLGEAVLRLYFAQIFTDGDTVLDLRSTAFNDQYEWCPRPIFYTWQPEFLFGLRNMYAGFYGKKADEFNLGLSQLNLSHAAGVIENHFGGNRSHAMRFSLQQLKESLHAIFVSCKANKQRLHADFFALGFYLLCLYQNLENLGCAFNVDRAFREVKHKDG